MTNNEHTWCIIMAGGLGSRFWPVAGADSPKQFIDVMGTGRTMLQSTFHRFDGICRREHILIVTGENYVKQVRQQVPDLEDYQVLGEPLRRNTAPCIAYAASVIKQMDPKATIIITPSDHAVFKYERFVADIRQAVDTVQNHDWIITMGAQPVRPDTSYGYIQACDEPSLPNAHNLHKAVTFTEKPPLELARQFISSGEFLWNAGILVLRLPVLEEAYRKHLPAIWESFLNKQIGSSRALLEEVYSTCEAVSIDNGVMEKADNVHVMSASFGWSDVETWGTLYDAVPHDSHGNAVLSGNVFTYNTRNCLVLMPDDNNKTVVIDGLDGYIVAASEDTLMVCRRSSEEHVFRFASDVELKKAIDKK